MGKTAELWGVEVFGGIFGRFQEFDPSHFKKHTMKNMEKPPIFENKPKTANQPQPNPQKAQLKPTNLPQTSKKWEGNINKQTN